MHACCMRPARPCPTWSSVETFAGIAEIIAGARVHCRQRMTRRGEFAGFADRRFHDARSGVTRQALPAFFPPLLLIPYFCRDVPLPPLFWVHFLRVPGSPVQIDPAPQEVCRRRFAA